MSLLFLILASFSLGGENTKSHYHHAPNNPTHRTQFQIRRRFPTTRKKITTPQKQLSVETSNKPWNGYFSAKNFNTNTNQGAQELSIVKNVLRTSILALPKEHTKNLKSLEVKNTYHKSRGLSNHEKIILHLDLIDNNQELSAVFLHEMGHIVDLGHLTGKSYYGRSSFTDRSQSIYRNDPSVKFYEISWRTSNLKNQNTTRKDFVSGYAMSNPFEDFAECYIFYRLHGDKFREFAKASIALQKKYNFFRDIVFDGEEFQTETIIANQTNNTQYDTTVLNFDMGELKD